MHAYLSGVAKPITERLLQMVAEADIDYMNSPKTTSTATSSVASNTPMESEGGGVLGVILWTDDNVFEIDTKICRLLVIIS